MHCRFTQTYKSVRIIKYLHLSMLMYSVLCIRLNIYILYTYVYYIPWTKVLLYFTLLLSWRYPWFKDTSSSRSHSDDESQSLKSDFTK